MIAKEGFTDITLQEIDNYINEILNGTEDFHRFNLSEHAGLCTAGAPLIGASIIACYATASLTAGSNVEGSEGQCKSRAEISSLDFCRDAVCSRSTEQGGPANWEIDEKQEQLIEQWAKAANLWEDNSEQFLIEEFGPMIAQGAEAKVYYKEGNTSVVKERTSIYSTWQKALDAIVLHNMLFPESEMSVIGFTRDSDNLMRIVLTQPYINCMRLATKEEIDDMVSAKGFRDNWNGQGVNYISDRLALEDMHPANVFVDVVTGKPICIDCIVKYVK
ncbi:MAG: hypothetical protein E7107_03365 [Prevotella sp.]|nr:hypothetical protein [Prevotella sp.]